MKTYSVYWLNREVATVCADRFSSDGKRTYFYFQDNVVASFDREFATSVRARNVECVWVFDEDGNCTPIDTSDNNEKSRKRVNYNYGDKIQD